MILRFASTAEDSRVDGHKRDALVDYIWDIKWAWL